MFGRWTTSPKEFGVPLYQRGEGVIHQLMYEKHKQNPGDIVCIADSHTGTCGGYGQIGIGVGSTELAAAMATGTLDLEVPQVVQIYLTGKRPSNVFGKDLILYLGSKFGSDYLVDRGLLLTGPGIDDLSIAERMTVCNMGIEIGSMITIFGTEEKESTASRPMRSTFPRSSRRSPAPSAPRTLFRCARRPASRSRRSASAAAPTAV